MRRRSGTPFFYAAWGFGLVAIVALPGRPTLAGVCLLAAGLVLVAVVLTMRIPLRLRGGGPAPDWLGPLVGSLGAAALIVLGIVQLVRG